MLFTAHDFLKRDI